MARGFALSGLDLAGVDVTRTEAGRQEIAAFVDELSRRGIDAGATRFTVYALPSIQEADDAVAGPRRVA